jgi:hypothetical protein
MNLKKINSKKSITLLALILASILISTASAAIYYSIIAQPAVTITAAPIVFAQGNDWPTGSTLGSNGTWVSLALKAYPNATLAYDQPLNLSNTDSSSHNFSLRHISITPASGTSQVGNFTSINFLIENAAGASQASFNYTVTSTTWNTPSTTSYLTLPASTQWIIYVSTVATAGANSGITANIQISVDVQQ